MHYILHSTYLCVFPHALTCTRRGALLRFQDTLRQAAKLDQEKVARQARHNQKQQNDSNNGAQLAREELDRFPEGKRVHILMDGPRNSARYEQQVHNAESREVES